MRSGFAPYQGVFENFAQASLEPHPPPSEWVSDRWIRQSLERLEAVRSGPTVSPVRSLGFNPFPLLAPLLDLAKQNPTAAIRVVDVGGNCGTLGLYLMRQFGLNNLHWTVIERDDFLSNPLLAERLPDEIVFNSRIERVEGPIDCLHFGSTLQYIESLDPTYSRVIEKSRPKWISIADFLGGSEVEDFVTRQRYHGGFFPVKFRNIPAFIRFMMDFGYELFLQVGSINEGNSRYWPSSHEPDKRQVPLPHDLLFRRLEL